MDFFGSVISGAWGIVKGTMVAAGEARKEAKMASGFKSIPALYVTDSGIWHTLAVYSKDRRFLQPKGIERLWRVKKSYPLDGGSPVVILYDKHVDSLDLAQPPKVMHPDKIALLKGANDQLIHDATCLDDPIKRQEALEAVSFADFSIPGAEELSSFGEDIANNTDMRFVQGVSRGKVILILAVGFLAGMLLGGIIVGVLVLSLTMGSGGAGGEVVG
jgi:hypothetical protein